MKVEDDWSYADFDNVAEGLAKAIDRELMDNIEAATLMAKKWVKSNVTAPQWVFDQHKWTTDTAVWCHLYCSGDYRLVNATWYFQLPEDATAFTLKWA